MTAHAVLAGYNILRYNGANPKNKSGASDKVWAVAKFNAVEFKGPLKCQVVTCYGPYGGTLQFHRYPIESSEQVDARFALLANGKRNEGYATLMDAFASKISDVFLMMQEHPLTNGASPLDLASISSATVTATTAMTLAEAVSKWQQVYGACVHCDHWAGHHGEAGCIFGNCNCQWEGTTVVQLASADKMPSSECENCRVNVLEAVNGGPTAREQFYKLECARCSYHAGGHGVAHPHENSKCKGLQLPAHLLRAKPSSFKPPKPPKPAPVPEPEPQKGVQPQPKREQRSIRHLLPTDL